MFQNAYFMQNIKPNSKTISTSLVTKRFSHKYQQSTPKPDPQATEHNQYQAREDIRRKLNTVLTRRLDGNWGLFMVGSSHTGLGLEQSDLDLCLVYFDNHDDFKLDQDFCMNRPRIMESLEKIQDILTGCDNFHVINLIRSAAVPILKIHYRHDNRSTPLSIDINIQKITSIYATFLFICYRNVDVRFRQLVIRVKSWANECGILSTYSGFLSSYAFTLMVIFFLQNCQPPVLPNLQAFLGDGFFQSSLFQTLEQNYYKLHQLQQLVLYFFKAQNTQTVDELFGNFLIFYHNLQFRCEINIRQCGFVEHNPANPLNSLIVVMDPFDQVNIATAVESPDCFKKILSSFEMGARTTMATKRQLPSLCDYRQFEQSKSQSTGTDQSQQIRLSRIKLRHVAR